MSPLTRLVAFLLQDTDCLPLVVAQGVLVSAIGLSMAIKSLLLNRGQS